MYYLGFIIVNILLKYRRCFSPQVGEDLKQKCIVNKLAHFNFLPVYKKVYM